MDIGILAFGYGIDYYADAAAYDTQRECLEEYSDIPWVLCGDENWEMTANFMDYIIPEKLMRITENTPYGIEKELEKADKFMIVARTNEGNTQGDMALYYYIGTTGRFAKVSWLWSGTDCPIFSHIRRSEDDVPAGIKVTYPLEQKRKYTPLSALHT